MKFVLCTVIVQANELEVRLLGLNYLRKKLSFSSDSELDIQSLIMTVVGLTILDTL